MAYETPLMWPYESPLAPKSSKSGLSLFATLFVRHQPGGFTAINDEPSFWSLRLNCHEHPMHSGLGLFAFRREG